MNDAKIISEMMEELRACPDHLAAECMDCGMPLGKAHDIDCPGAESEGQLVMERHCAIEDEHQDRRRR